MSGSWDAFGKEIAPESNQAVDAWADFGGFESAQPIPPSLSSTISTGTISWATSLPTATQQSQVSNNVQDESEDSNQSAAPSPWSVFPPSSNASSIQSIPDVVKTETTSASLPWGFNIGGAEQSDADGNALTDRNDHMPWNQTPVPVDNEATGTVHSMPWTQTPVPDDNESSVLDQSMPWEASPTPISSNESSTSDAMIENASKIVSDVPWGAYPVSNGTAIHGWPADVTNQHVVQTQGQSVDGAVQTSLNKLAEPLQGPCSVPEYVQQHQKEIDSLQTKRQNLEKECESLHERNQSLEDEVEQQKVTLDEQKKKYELLQTKQHNQLKDLRDSGQEAFALIVEEYKELSKTAVLEQQEQCMRYMKDALDEERKKCEELLKEQHENLMRLLEQEKQENVTRIEESLKKLEDKCETEIASAVAEERSRGQEFMSKAVDEERESGKKALEEFVEKERETLGNLTQEHQDFTQTLMDDERKKCQELIEGALEQERINMKHSLEEAVKEERKKAEELAKETLEMTKKEMDNYVQQKLKDDAVIRQKYLLSMDLFLEGTRTQLRSLMEEQETKEHSPQDPGSS